MPRKRTDRPTRPMTADRAARYTWSPKDITITYPPSVAALAGMDDELHTVLWSLEHASNSASLEEVLPNALHYLIAHPGERIVDEAIKRAYQRLEHAT